MQTSVFLAKLIGPILVLVGVSLLVNRKGFEALAREALGSPTLLYLFGLLDFTAGLAIVLVHNIWVADWQVIITILGWLLIIRGVVRTLFIEQVKPFATRFLKNKTAVTMALAVTLGLGLVLSYFGYRL
jgi:hypothetical protein